MLKKLKDMFKKKPIVLYPISVIKSGSQYIHHFDSSQIDKYQPEIKLFMTKRLHSITIDNGITTFRYEDDWLKEVGLLMKEMTGIYETEIPQRCDVILQEEWDEFVEKGPKDE